MGIAAPMNREADPMKTISVHSCLWLICSAVVACSIADEDTASRDDHVEIEKARLDRFV